jgi:DNA-binding GntR family transcriptional regulator
VTLFKSREDQTAFIGMLSREHEQIYAAILCGDPKLAAKFHAYSLDQQPESLP